MTEVGLGSPQALGEPGGGHTGELVRYSNDRLDQHIRQHAGERVSRSREREAFAAHFALSSRHHLTNSDHGFWSVAAQDPAPLIMLTAVSPLSDAVSSLSARLSSLDPAAEAKQPAPAPAETEAAKTESQEASQENGEAAEPPQGASSLRHACTAVRSTTPLAAQQLLPCSRI